MTLSEALDLVVSRTGVERYRQLCSDENSDVEQRDAYRLLVLRLAGIPESLPPPSPARPPVSLAMLAMRWGFKSCFYSTHEGCGCAGTHCHARRRDVLLSECIECLGVSTIRHV